MDCLDGKRKREIRDSGGNEGRTDGLLGWKEEVGDKGSGNEERIDGLLGWKEEEGDKGWWGERGKD